ncbi:DUF3298 and DUF4163 domain-containing protein [Robiginitalea sp. SC105]|uniref:DUF3298 and DUF4163 domain-containing protein n=1 Tax=Robiginitalea sp. SC105 TaxID=2762332 RepID=UPI001639B8EB|nr:DUF3298 and DUF4163 domain-containing protein [Robiginitalea sp. SC105]MBC2838020.1 DUF3298 and DUF4163 domain-containing protein [Robiginitalea sp. SC105]
MKHCTRLLLLLTFLGCAEGEELRIQPREYLGEACADCPVVRVDIPEASEDRALGRVVNTSVREEVIEWLDYDEEAGASDIPEAIRAFGAGYRNLKTEFPDELVGWEATVEGSVTYESSELLSLKLEGYIFTGGAHGFSRIRYLNFDKDGARELDNRDLFRNLPDLEALAEKHFRETQGISPEVPINSTGFMFEENTFSLPENIGFEPEGLVLLYNPYEVASYADGPVRILIPYREAAPYIVLSDGMLPPS